MDIKITLTVSPIHAILACPIRDQCINPMVSMCFSTFSVPTLESSSFNSGGKRAVESTRKP
jgi:hypothetical protein